MIDEVEPELSWSTTSSKTGTELRPGGTVSGRRSVYAAVTLFAGSWNTTLSDRMGKRKPLYIVGNLILAVGWALILFNENLSFSQLGITLWVTGFFSGCMIISFAFTSESVPRALSGTVSGLTNMGVMMGPMLLQPAVGKILDHYWTGTMTQGVRTYSLNAYETGFIPMMAWVILSIEGQLSQTLPKLSASLLA